MPQVTVEKIVEGATNILLKVSLLNNDASGELTNYPILDPNGVVPPAPIVGVVPKPAAIVMKPAFRLLQVWYGLVWFDLTMYSGTITPWPMWTLARDCDSHTDFRSFGGIVEADGVPPVGDTGILNISTNGFTQQGSQGVIVLSLKKNNPVALP